MQRSVKQDWDYRILHTSGESVIKLVKMTERLKQNDLDCVDEMDAYIEDHNVQHIDDIDEAKESLKEFSIIVARFKECQTELKLALGDKYEVLTGAVHITRIYLVSTYAILKLGAGSSKIAIASMQISRRPKSKIATACMLQNSRIKG